MYVFIPRALARISILQRWFAWSSASLLRGRISLLLPSNYCHSFSISYLIRSFHLSRQQQHSNFIAEQKDVLAQRGGAFPRVFELGRQSMRVFSNSHGVSERVQRGIHGRHHVCDRCSVDSHRPAAVLVRRDSEQWHSFRPGGRFTLGWLNA